MTPEQLQAGARLLYKARNELQEFRTPLDFEPPLDYDKISNEAKDQYEFIYNIVAAPLLFCLEQLENKEDNITDYQTSAAVMLEKAIKAIQDYDAQQQARPGEWSEYEQGCIDGRFDAVRLLKELLQLKLPTESDGQQ